MIPLRRWFLVATTTCAALLPATPAAGSETGRKPNIVFVLVDDLGWRDVGFAGSRYYRTPHIDRLAAEGRVFTQAYALPSCAPARASLMTGLHPTRHGIYAVDAYARTPERMQKVRPVNSPLALPARFTTIAEVLRRAGYATAHIGKWHLGDAPEQLPTARGFDLNIGGSNAGAPNSFFSPYGRSIPEALLPRSGLENEHLTDRLTIEACRFIAEKRERPFFLYLSYYDVHVPAPLRQLEARRDLYEQARARAPDGEQDSPAYAAMVAAVDEGVGQVLETLRRAGLDRNTVVFFTSDNGGQIMCTDMRPLRGQKGNVYEGGIRVPLAVRWPGVIAGGKHDDTPVTVLDFFPTLAEIAGAKLDAGLRPDGESLVGLLRGNAPLRRDAIFFHHPLYHGNGRSNAKLWQPPASVIRMGDWKLVQSLEDDAFELYHLHTDPGEQRNRAAEEPEIARRLRQRLEAWQREVGAPVALAPNPAFEPSSRDWIAQANRRTPGEGGREPDVRVTPRLPLPGP